MLFKEETGQWQPISGISRTFQPEGSSPPARFFDALASGAEMPITMYDGRRCVQLLVAAERAGKEKRQVAISEYASS